VVCDPESPVPEVGHPSAIGFRRVRFMVSVVSSVAFLLRLIDRLRIGRIAVSLCEPWLLRNECMLSFVGVTR
jgi:hypothetical protein